MSLLGWLAFKKKVPITRLKPINELPRSTNIAWEDFQRLNQEMFRGTNIWLSATDNAIPVYVETLSPIMQPIRNLI